MEERLDGSPDGRTVPHVVTRYTIMPLQDFLPDYDWDHDDEYQHLKQDLTDWQVEFAKSRVIHPNGAEALRHITEEPMSEVCVRNRVQMIRNKAKRNKLEQLEAYLRLLYNRNKKIADEADKGPMSLEEITRILEKSLRTTKDPALQMQLSEKVVKFRGLETKPAAAAAEKEDPFAIPAGFLDDLNVAHVDD